MIKLTIEQAKELHGKEYASGCFFNVVYDINDEPFISEEEQRDSDIEWLKELTPSEFAPKQYEL